MQILREAKVKKETEKAVLIEVLISDGYRFSRQSHWFPKTQVVIDNNLITAEEWIINKRNYELAWGQICIQLSEKEQKAFDDSIFKALSKANKKR